MAKNANPLALVATAQTLQDPYYQTSKPHKSYAPTSKASLPTRSHATTRYKGKEIVPNNQLSQSMKAKNGFRDSTYSQGKRCCCLNKLREKRCSKLQAAEQSEWLADMDEWIVEIDDTRVGTHITCYMATFQVRSKCRLRSQTLSHWNRLKDELDELESDKADFPNMNDMLLPECMYRIASSTTQTRAPQLTQTSRNTNPRVSTSTGVAHKTNVSRPQPRSNQMKDKVMPNTSHVKFKKTEVEEHPRISSISNQTKSITACNDSLNSRTLKLMLFVLTVENMCLIRIMMLALVFLIFRKM
ncbi:hypothetical protein Tco_0015952 [Tanacetum coccineum]